MLIFLLFMIGIFLVILLSANWLWHKALISNEHGRYIMITGCDSGFGYGLTTRLAEKGHFVFATCLTVKGFNTIRENFPDGSVKAFIMDITKQEDVEKVQNEIEQILDSENAVLWGLVNNAGFLNLAAPDDWLVLEDYRGFVEVNTFGPIRVCHAFKPFIKKAKGRIIFSSSIRARLVGPEEAPYSVSKYALEAYADGLRQDLYYFDVNVSILEPGSFTTPLTTNYEERATNAEKAWERLSQSEKSEWPRECLNSRTTKIRKNAGTATRSDNIEPVIDAMCHALFSVNPKSRYVLGYNAVYYYRLLTFMPAAMQDFLMRHWYTKGWKKPSVFYSSSAK